MNYPKPTALKLLQGNPGKRRINTREPQPANGLPQCPRHLNDEARREWRRIVRDYGQTGVITRVDRAALAAYCQSWSLWVETSESLARTGLVIKTTNGNFIQNPILGIANRAKLDMQRWANELGITPASRTRVQAPAQVTEDEFTAFLQGKGRSG